MRAAPLPARSARSRAVPRRRFFGSAFGGGFGGFGGFGGGGEPETPKGRTVTVDLEVTLRDLYLGATFEVVRERASYKQTKGTRKCNCKTRMSTRQIAPGMYQQYPVQSCDDCPAMKLVHAPETLHVEVEPGMRDGTEITFFEQGEPLLDGEPGDLKFRLVTVAPAAARRGGAAAPGAGFERRGDDLHVGVAVTLTDALVGFERSLAHLDGRAVPLRQAGVTRPGAVQRLKGEGMPLPGATQRRGDMVVTYSIEVRGGIASARTRCHARSATPAPASVATLETPLLTPCAAQMPAALSDEQKDVVRELFKFNFPAAS